MPRLTVLGSVSLVALACATLPACGRQDAEQSLLAQCSDPPPNRIDSCIAQVRARQETDTSPQLESLMARLIKYQIEAQSPPPPAEPQPPMPDDGSDPNGFEALPTPPASSDMDSGTYEAPPDAAPQDVAPPTEQVDPANADQNDTDAPPQGSDEQNPPPNNGGGPGRA